MTQYSPTHIFTLGREWKLSLAELFSVFGRDAYVFHTETIAFFALNTTEKKLLETFARLGGSIRIMEIAGTTSEKTFPTDVIRLIEKTATGGKIQFALGAYGATPPLAGIGLRMKKTLTESGHSVRCINQENTNINSASFKKEKLGRSRSEYSLIKIENEDTAYIGITLACQDIDAYAKRDTAKVRDMEIGMMPPKLCQTIINLASGGADPKNLRIYDPFCGLGTFLIEAANMGITHISGSDLSTRMVEASRKSLEQFVAEEKVWQERIRTAGGTPAKDFSHFVSDIFEMNATDIYKVWKEKSLDQTIIVSEGYLGEIMQKDSITLDRVQKERTKLVALYDGFFRGLKALEFDGMICMTFPFWDIRGMQSFFNEIHDVFAKHGFAIVPTLPTNLGLMTKKQTLLYKRPGQNVGREVILLERI